MSRLPVLLALGLGAACATPAAPPPQPAPPPPPAATETVKSEPLVAAPAGQKAPVTDGDVTVGEASGIQVIVQRWPGAELATTLFALRGGVLDADARTAGADLLGLRTAASGGTQTLDKDAYSRRLTKLGSTIDGDSAPNYSTLTAKSLLSAWESTFDLLVDVYLHPALPGSELDLQRQRQLQQLKREQENPDGALTVLAQKMLFAGTPYANRPVGT
ncbi:MAG TPA: insulinase family protein, partial [Myxococcaceae bacterium]|nr:insulinase family protein [Myxococcaceae bacterium]